MSEIKAKTSMKRGDKIHASALLMMVFSAIGLYFAAKQGIFILTIALLVVFISANLLEFTNK